jgi:hypothetical protein
MSRDDEHLKLLTIFHYVLAGLTAFSGSFFAIYVVMGLFMLSASSFAAPGGPPPGAPGGPPPTFMGWLFVAFGAFTFSLMWAFAVGLALAGRYLARRRGYRFCFVVACVGCTSPPLGTALGVCTMLVLLRPSVKVLFGVAPAPPQPEDDWPERPLPARGPDDRYYAAPRTEPK